MKEVLHTLNELCDVRIKVLNSFERVIYEMKCDEVSFKGYSILIKVMG